MNYSALSRCNNKSFAVRAFCAKFINKTLILLLILILLNGCSTDPSYSYWNSTELLPAAKNYLEKASAVKGDDNHQYLLLAVNQLLVNNNVKDAQQLLSALNRTKLNQNNLQQKRIMLARLALQKDQPRSALRELHKVKELKALPKNIQMLYYAVAIAVYLRNNNLAYSAIARMSLNSLLEDPKTQLENNKIIFYNLQTFSLNSLNELFKRSSSSLLRGWFQLAAAVKQNANTPSFLASAIKFWQKTYPNHPANSLLSNEHINALTVDNQFQQLKQIALLLPLHGKFAKAGQAIRDGFMTAYYADSKKTPNAAGIKIYDTSQAQGIGITEIYNQALQRGAQFVVGPLTKTNVMQLMKQEKTFPAPTLLLNYFPANFNSSFFDYSVDGAPNDKINMIQIGLSPEQEAAQAAERAWQHGVNRILILTAKGDRGDKIKQAFIARFQQLGGLIIKSVGISAAQKLSSQIAAALNIDQSKSRAVKLQNLIGKNFKKVDRRRQDINGIFFAASSSAQARQINPLLKFYYAENLPVFSISNVYAGYPNRRRDQELNGIYFNDMQWLLSNAPNIKKLKQTIYSLWPSNYQNNSRLYGLGIDAFTLSKIFNRLILLPDVAVNGATGLLLLNSNNQIYRKLLPVQFEHGVPQMSSVSPECAIF